MDYQRIYNKIINNRKQNTPDVYTEKHHIIPKSLGGSNTKDNIVRLTAREHFICHLLLIRIYKDDKYKWAKMMSAFCRMLQQPQEEQKRYCPSKWYAYMRENLSKAMKINQGGERNSQYGKHWIINPETGEKKSLQESEIQTYLDNGWIRGRTLKPKKYIKLTPEQKTLNKQQRAIQRMEQRKSIVDKYRTYYHLYNEYGWETFKQMTNYPYSKQNLVMLFKHNLPEFKPQNGKKRGN